MIYTSYFAKINNLPDTIIPISIAGKAPDEYRGLQYKKLAPKIDFFQKWKETKDNDYYITHYNEEVLNKLNSHMVISELYKMTGGKDFALTCYEKPGDFCHRKLIAEWLEKSGYDVTEWNEGLRVNDVIISVTGHRPNKLYGYNMKDKRYISLKENFKEHLLKKKCTKAVSGMALGVDQLYAEAVIELKEMGHPIELIAAVPCRNHSCKWPRVSQEHYDELLNKADKIVLVSDQSYEPHLMQLRNEYMVNISTDVIAIWDGTKSGTGNCVRYAETIKRPITIINPTEL